MVWIVLLAAIVFEGVLIMQPSASSQQRHGSPSAIRAAQTTKSACAHRAAIGQALPALWFLPLRLNKLPSKPASVRAKRVLPPPSLRPVLAEQAAFKAGHQWCHSLSTVGHHGSSTKR